MTPAGTPSLLSRSSVSLSRRSQVVSVCRYHDMSVYTTTMVTTDATPSTTRQRVLIGLRKIDLPAGAAGVGGAAARLRCNKRLNQSPSMRGPRARGAGETASRACRGEVPAAGTPSAGHFILSLTILM